MTDISWSFYDLATGVFSGAAFCGTSDEVASQLAHKGGGVGAHPAAVDYLRQKLALDTGLLIAHAAPGPALSELKAIACETINAARLRANQGMFSFGGKRFQCDALGRSDIDGMNGCIALLRALPTTWLGQWKAGDNSFLPIPDVATWTAFYGAMVAQGQANFVQSQTLKAQIDAATTPEAVALVIWPA